MHPHRLYFDHSLVFPFSWENFHALITHYFHKNGIVADGPNSIEVVFKNSMAVSLGEFEFIVKCITGHLSYFNEHLKFGGMTISNLCQYGLDAYLGVSVGKTSNRSRITNGFRDIIKIEILKQNGNTSLQKISSAAQ